MPNESVRIVEVGPRDGLQNEARMVPAAAKIQLIERLAEAGLRYIEATAFVSPKWVPQMADHSEVLRGIRRTPGVVYAALTPNAKGFEEALAAGADEIAVFASASETFSQKNLNCSVAESFARFQPVFTMARSARIPVRGYVSCVLGCPYEGDVPPQQVIAVARHLFDAGCREISLGDTVGVGTPTRASRLFEAVAKHVPISQLAGHFHDTYGQALANIHASLEIGVRVFDSSVSGLGGCPYAPGALGNVATEDLLYLLDGMGFETGIDMRKLIAAGAFICDRLGIETHSRAARAIAARR
jgi:hydroxymethylglutaryl-CoA lyase